MSMNKDLVAQAVAAIPMWITFLNQKDAEQDALLAQMQKPKKKTLKEKATSLLNRKPKNQQFPGTEPRFVPESAAPDPESKDEVSWAPADIFTIEEEQEQKQEEQEQQQEQEQQENQFQNLF